VVVVATSRADLGHLRRLLEEAEASPVLEVHLLVTGALAALGSSPDGPPGRAVGGPPADDSPAAAAVALGAATTAFAEELERLDPAALLVLGDRYELLGPAAAALLRRCPILHVHGGVTA
jgi:UDP-N-acetylglucosamine 2-epimerase